MADFCRGFTYERDVPVPGMLTIEGKPVDGFRETARRFHARLPWNEPISEPTLPALVRTYLDRTGALASRLEATEEHLAALVGRRDYSWHDWRLDHAGVHPMFAGVDARIHFKRKRFDGYDFSYANFTQAKLQGLSFRGANFHQAILAGADLSGAHLEGANFCRTDLYRTRFRGASLRGANLQGVQLAMTDLTGADLCDCTVYGMSAWDVKLKKAKEQRLLIRYRPTRERRGTEEEIRVDGLDPAAFLYFALNNRNIATIVNAASEKWVLILGRFTEHRDRLDGIANALRKEQFIPVIFDFERPKQRDLIETVVLLAGLSAFVIVELTNPRSVPLELQAIASSYAVPIVPIIQERVGPPFSMFSALRKFRWVAQPVEYTSTNNLIAKLRRHVIAPAKAQRRRLERLKRQLQAD